MTTHWVSKLLLNLLLLFLKQTLNLFHWETEDGKVDDDDEGDKLSWTLAYYFMDVNHAFDILELIILRTLDKVANWAGQARENLNMFPIIQFDTKWLYVPVNYKKKAWLYTSDTRLYAT